MSLTFLSGPLSALFLFIQAGSTLSGHLAVTLLAQAAAVAVPAAFAAAPPLWFCILCPGKPRPRVTAGELLSGKAALATQSPKTSPSSDLPAAILGLAAPLIINFGLGELAAVLCSRLELDDTQCFDLM